MNKLNIIMYHYVRESKKTKFPNIKSLELKEFKNQLDFLKKNKVNELTAYFDQNMTFFKSLKLRGIPTTLLINQQNIIAKKEGIFSYNKVSLEQINNFFN